MPSASSCRRPSGAAQVLLQGTFTPSVHAHAGRTTACSGRRFAPPLMLSVTQKPSRLDRDTAAPYSCPMIFIETSIFTRLLYNYLTDEEYTGLQMYLLQKPDAGDLIRGSGGVRKVRWAPAGTGKSGGIRVIYYWKKSKHEMWMLTLYSKSERASIPGHTLKQISEAIKNG